MYLGLFVFLFFILWGCATVTTDRASLPEPIPLNEPRQVSYLLQLGDEIDVKFFYYPELNESVTIRPDGMFSLQLVGEIQAVGKTPSELSQILCSKYAEYLEKPEVSALVKRLANERAYVGGEVRSPAEIPIRGRLTLMQAVIRAGGLTDQAKPSDIILLRLEGSRLRVLKVNFDEILEKGAGDVMLQPLDIVYVPRTAIANVGKFVDQYINQIIPRVVSFPLIYMLNPSDSGGTLTITPSQ